MPTDSALLPLTFVLCLMLLAIVIALFSITKALRQLTEVVQTLQKKDN